MTKKKFFQERSKEKILKLNLTYSDSNLISLIENLDEENGLVVEKLFIPERFYYSRKNFPGRKYRWPSKEASRKFLKHGPEVELRGFKDLDSIKNIDIDPVDLRREAFNTIKKKAYSCFSFIPFDGDDKRKRKVSLNEDVESARLYAYAKHAFPQQLDFVNLIEIKGYDISDKVKSEGATVAVRVPSRRKNIPKYDFNLISAPIVDSYEKLAVVHSIASSGFGSKAKQYGFGYKYLEDKEDSRNFRFFAHEIVAYFRVIAEYKKNGNLVPLEMNPFAIPTQKTVDFYKNLDKILIRDEWLESEDKLRKLNKAEKEILLWGFVEKYKHDSTFYSEEKIENYNWK